MGKLVRDDIMNILRKAITNIKFYIKKIRKNKVYNKKDKFLNNQIDINQGEKLKLNILFYMYTGKNLY